MEKIAIRESIDWAGLVLHGGGVRVLGTLAC